MDETVAPIQKLWHMPQCKVIYERYQCWGRFSAFYLLEGFGCPRRSSEGVWELGREDVLGVHGSVRLRGGSGSRFWVSRRWGMALVSAGVLEQACSEEASASHISSLGPR